MNSYILNLLQDDINSADSLQAITDILTSTKDISACLTNCSNNGVCALDADQNFYCSCFEFYSGKTCDNDLRQCSSGPCLWNGNCTNIINGSSYDFECKCPYPHYGRYCHLTIDLCENITCYQRQGFCKVDGSIAYCKCFSDFLGNNCEKISQQLQTVKTVCNITASVSFIIIALFLGLVILNDFSRFVSFLLNRSKPIKKIIKKKKPIVKAKNKKSPKKPEVKIEENLE